MIINANTKIAKILKENNAALEAIISIDNKFEKLRNPLLRKLMASRTSIGMAAKISGCEVDAFYEKLQPLGFEIDKEIEPATLIERTPLPIFFTSLKPSQIIELDVRDIINSGEDPLPIIIKKVKEVPTGGALKIINSFEPTPLLSLLKKQGFENYVDTINDQLVETYFYKVGDNTVEINEAIEANKGWDAYVAKFQNNIETIDVRQLEMPGPMMAILEALEKLPASKALYVYHKRIPVFLLPELKEKGFDFRIKEISDGEVHLFIFKD